MAEDGRMLPHKTIPSMFSLIALSKNMLVFIYQKILGDNDDR